jgi:hypothetical protein
MWLWHEVEEARAKAGGAGAKNNTIKAQKRGDPAVAANALDKEISGLVAKVAGLPRDQRAAADAKLEELRKQKAAMFGSQRPSITDLQGETDDGAGGAGGADGGGGAGGGAARQSTAQTGNFMAAFDRAMDRVAAGMDTPAERAAARAAEHAHQLELAKIMADKEVKVAAANMEAQQQMVVGMTTAVVSGLATALAPVLAALNKKD